MLSFLLGRVHFFQGGLDVDSCCGARITGAIVSASIGFDSAVFGSLLSCNAFVLALILTSVGIAIDVLIRTVVCSCPLLLFGCRY